MMNVIAKALVYSCFVFCIGCSGESISSYQYNSTVDKLHCYDTIRNSIINNTALASYLSRIRDSKQRGRHDPVTVSSEFRTIDAPELKSFLTQYIDSSCLVKFDQEGDFSGLRFIGNELIIIEVDRFNRHTLGTYYSTYKTIELHRLVYSKNKPNLDEYGYGKESEMLYEQLDSNCFYQVTQLYVAAGAFK